MDRPIISTVVLNWNRARLLRVTVESYLATTSAPHELFLVDNASTDESPEYIQTVSRQNPRVHAVLLKRNLGGRAFNAGLRQARGQFLHTSENDIEYLPGWDTEILRKFETFPELGQLSPFSAEPNRAAGEVWESHDATPLERAGLKILISEGNITSTGIMRREVWDRGFRWGTILVIPGQRFRPPDDFSASNAVRDAGYLVAWNDRYTVINWGHNVEEWRKNVEYYLENYQGKPWLGVAGMRQRLLAQGYDLVQNGRRFEIVRRDPAAAAEAGPA